MSFSDGRAYKTKQCDNFLDQKITRRQKQQKCLTKTTNLASLLTCRSVANSPIRRNAVGSRRTAAYMLAHGMATSLRVW